MRAVVRVVMLYLNNSKYTCRSKGKGTAAADRGCSRGGVRRTAAVVLTNLLLRFVIKDLSWHVHGYSITLAEASARALQPLNAAAAVACSTHKIAWTASMRFRVFEGFPTLCTEVCICLRIFYLFNL